MGDIFDDLFGSGFGHGSHRQSYSQKGQDITARISVPFDDAVHGNERVIHLQDASGRETSLKVKIPAGIDSGKKIRLKGKGEPSPYGGEPGDLLLEVTVEEKAGFERKGNDVYTKVQVPYTTAVLGGEAIVQTLYGKVKCKIQAGTQSGTKIRLRGKGNAGYESGFRKRGSVCCCRDFRTKIPVSTGKSKVKRIPAGNRSLMFR